METVRDTQIKRIIDCYVPITQFLSVIISSDFLLFSLVFRIRMLVYQ